mgnify:FL=1
MTNLAPYNTFQVSVFAKDFLELNNISQCHSGLDPESIIIGLGANILFTKDYDGLVIKNNLKGKKIIKENDKEVLIEVASGENWHEFVMWAVDNNWSGVENLAYIPGTVGAAPVQNIAAYGQTAGETIDRVKTSDGLEFTNKECKFYYRDSIFKHELKNKKIITSVVFKLSKIAKGDTHYYGRFSYESLQTYLDKVGKPPYTPKQIATAVIEQRTVKMPDWTKVGTAGSFFRNPFVKTYKFDELKKLMPDLQPYPINQMLYPNPDDPVFKMTDMVKIPAGRLFDELGWRGKRIGNVATHEKHALIVINCGGASGQEILEFTQKMQFDVKRTYDIDLEPEVNII